MENKFEERNEFSARYMNLLSLCKTERETVYQIKNFLSYCGYINATGKTREELKNEISGGKFFFENDCKELVVFNINNFYDLEKNGLNIIGSHIDSPRLDIKSNPIVEKENYLYFDTHYYGGIKKYQWVTIPLAIHGVVFKKDGSFTNVEIGENDYDSVFCITDLLPHLGSEQMKKTVSDLFSGESLDVLIGLDKSENKSTKENIIKILKDMDIISSEDDFLSAELEIVPSGKPKNCGIDNSMVIGYGQDDKVCAIPSLFAFHDVSKNLNENCCLLFVDKEEIGSVGKSGMESCWFENRLKDVVYSMIGNSDSDYIVSHILEKSHMLSADVNAGYDPMFSDVYDKNNSSILGNGVTFCKFTGSRGKVCSNDASPEYIAKLRNCMDLNDVKYQFAEIGKVDKGGGGTIAYILANKCVNVIDCGVGVLNMHAPWEITSKSDIYEMYKAYKSFLLTNFNK